MKRALITIAAIAGALAFGAIETSKWGFNLTTTGTPTQDDLAAMRQTVDQENARRQTVEIVNGGNPASLLAVEPQEKLIESYRGLVQLTIDRMHRQAVETAYIARINAAAQQKAFNDAVAAAVASTTNKPTSK